MSPRLGASALCVPHASGYGEVMSNTGATSRSFRLHLLPQTPPGRWSGALLLAGIALFIANILTVTVGGQSGPGFNPWIAITIIPAGVAAVLAGITAAYAVVRKGERSVLVFVPLFVGLLVAWFVIGEVVTPH